MALPPSVIPYNRGNDCFSVLLEGTTSFHKPLHSCTLMENYIFRQTQTGAYDVLFYRKDAFYSKPPANTTQRDRPPSGQVKSHATPVPAGCKSPAPTDSACGNGNQKADAPDWARHPSR